MFLGVLSVAYFVSFKNYHASLEKLQHLSDMFKNPNARVASGKKGKKLMKKLAEIEASDSESSDEEEVKPVKKSKKLKASKKPMTEMELTLEKVQALIEAKKQLSTVAPQVENLYVPPQVMAPAPQAHYKLSTDFPIISAQPQAFIPQTVVDLPTSSTYPQLHMIRAPAPVVQAAPQVATSALDNLSKADLVKLLLAQLAKEDADARV